MMKNPVQAVERALEDARQGLIRADAAGISAAETAMGTIERIRTELTSATPAELQRVRHSMRRVERLAEALQVFHEGLARLTSLLDDAAANYTRDGAAKAVPSSGSSVNVHG